MDPNLQSDAWQKKFIESMHEAFGNIMTLMFHPKEKIAEKLNIETTAYKTFRDNLM